MIKNIVVIGSGTMGRGIALQCALSGFKTLLFDINSQALELAKQSNDSLIAKLKDSGKISSEKADDYHNNISYVTDNHLLIGDLIIEAIVEKLDVKQKLFAYIEANNQDSAILCSNTSSLSITEIAAALKHPERFAGLHFFNPAHLMKLVEITAGAATTPEVMLKLKKFCQDINKQSVTCADRPGFIVNRVARHYYTESLKLLEEQALSKESLDELLEATGFKMGPFKLMDFIGHDVNYFVTKSLYDGFFYEARYRPSKIQEQLVLAKHFGKKSGKGFYNYS